MKGSVVIPQGYKKVAVSKQRNTEVSIYFSEEAKLLYGLLYDVMKNQERSFGPFTELNLPVLIHALDDVKEMKGRYNYLSEDD